MSYAENSLTTVKQLKNLAEKNKAEIDTLTLAQSVLDARMNAQVTASTDADADYAAEVVDARIDAWSNEQASLGANIRDGQQRIAQGLQLVQRSHQEQINSLAEALLEEATGVAETLETRRLEISKEEEVRIEKDTILQKQIDTLSNAILDICTQLSKIREILRTQ